MVFVLLGDKSESAAMKGKSESESSSSDEDNEPESEGKIRSISGKSLSLELVKRRSHDGRDACH